MAESPSPATSEHQALPEDLNPKSNQPDPSQPTGAVLPPPPPQASSSPSPSPSVSSLASSAPVTVNPSSTPPVLIPPPPSIHHHHPYPMPGGAIMPPTAPSFRPASNPPVQLSTTPQFSPLPNPGLQTPNFQSAGLQNPSVQPPGVNPAPAMLPNPVMRSYAPMPNGYPAMPTHAPQGIMPPAVS